MVPPNSARYTPPRNPIGNADQSGEQQQFSAADDGVRHAAAGLAHRSWQLCEEIPVQALAAIDEQIAQDENQQFPQPVAYKAP